MQKYFTGSILYIEIGRNIITVSKYNFYDKIPSYTKGEMRKE